MHSNLLVAIATVASVANAAAVSAVHATFKYPADVKVTEFPTGLPEALREALANGTHAPALGKRENGGVYFCTDRNFGGYCQHIVAPLYACINLSPNLNDKVSSVGPDKPRWGQFYSAQNCDDKEGHFGTFSPGYSDLSSAGSPGSYWNDRISSYFVNPN